MTSQNTPDVLTLTAQIVAAHVANNRLDTDALPILIKSVYAALSTVGTVETKPDAQLPAVPVKKSVFADYIVCLEDGKKLKMLKRHLKTAYNMTPDDYRTKWGLPHDYPMTAPSYAATRSTLAKTIGLGRKPAQITTLATVAPPVTKVPARRARGAKV